MSEQALEPADGQRETPLHATTSLCRECKNAVPARVVSTASGEVRMRKICREHGEQAVRLSTNAAWYEET